MEDNNAMQQVMPMHFDLGNNAQMILVIDAHQPTKDKNLVSTAGSCMADAGWGCRTPSNDGCHPLHTVRVQDSHILYQLTAPLSAACIPNMCIALSQEHMCWSSYMVCHPPGPMGIARMPDCGTMLASSAKPPRHW